MLLASFGLEAVANYNNSGQNVRHRPAHQLRGRLNRHGQHLWKLLWRYAVQADDRDRGVVLDWRSIGHFIRREGACFDLSEVGSPVLSYIPTRISAHDKITGILMERRARFK